MKVGKFTITVGDINSPLSVIDRTSRWKIRKDIEKLNNTINQLNLTGIYRTLHTTIAEYEFLSSAHETFTKIDNTLGYKTNLNKFKITGLYKVSLLIIMKLNLKSVTKII